GLLDDIQPRIEPRRQPDPIRLPRQSISQRADDPSRQYPGRVDVPRTGHRHRFPSESEPAISAMEPFHPARAAWECSGAGELHGRQGHASVLRRRRDQSEPARPAVLAAGPYEAELAGGESILWN